MLNEEHALVQRAIQYDSQARALERAARLARLVLRFTVDQIWLIEFVPTVAEPRTVNRIGSFAFSQPQQ
jgi:hypothetical protein